VEKLHIKRWPRENNGSFYSGDSYIVLNTYTDPATKDKKLYNVHFWLGKDTSQDEAGVAAYKTVELDDLLGQLPVQFREVQNFENESFLKLFDPPGMRTMDGGVDSGFNHVSPEAYQARLLQVKGKKAVRVTQVPLSSESLNQGDVFILDNGLELFQWNGENATIKEKRKAMDVVQSIKAERNGKPHSIVLDGEEDNDTFWALLGGKGPVKSAADGGDDNKVEDFTKRMVRVSDQNGAISMTEVATGRISKAALDTNDVFIIDTEPAIYVWIGAGASHDEKGQAFKMANEYLVQYGRPFTTPVIRVVEGCTNAAFDGAFR